MSLSSANNKIIFSPSGATTEYTFNIKYFSDADIVVTKLASGDTAETTLTRVSSPANNLQYKVEATGGDSANGCLVTIGGTGYTTGDKVTVERIVAVTQEYDLQDGATIDPTALNTGLDRAVAQNQQQQEILNNSVSFPVTDSDDRTYSITESATSRANKLIGFDASGNVNTQSFSSVAGSAVTGGNGIDITANQVSVDVVSTDFDFNSGELRIKSDAVTYDKMQDTSTNNRVLGAASAGTIGEVQVATDMIADDAVTTAKMAHLASMKALGNVTGGSATPAEVSILDEDTMSSNSATSLATQQSIKAYVDLLRPKYIAISGTSGSTALTQSTGGSSQGGSTATFTYTLSELTGGTGLDSTKFTDIYVICKCDVKQHSGASTAATATISATFPDGTEHEILDLDSPSAEDDRQILEQVIKVPINVSQTTFVLKHTVAGSSNVSAVHKCDTTIIGANQFKV